MDEIQLLYVDKSKTAQRLLVKALSPVAYVTCASSLADARDAMAERAFNFLITDFELPDGDGLTLTAELRATPGHEQTPVLLYTASVNNDLAYRAMKVGVNDSLQKPADMMSLTERVVQLVEVPEVKHVVRELTQVVCFAWTADGVYHEYSPDLNQHLFGSDAASVRLEVQRLLETRFGATECHSADPVEPEAVKHIIKTTARRDDTPGAAA